ncbi:hypothetical protein BDN72DRAFT_773420 [Pluteus cervinus]|uniref:Uncharacterized protein n=1 Tax=Pluteus cervinus TaxID=181527 RepID=A0ACD3AIH1_9AGAR|nr:hypothetical protein BDN72DRAFT_773420 [Pluteus cervinus]
MALKEYYKRSDPIRELAAGMLHACDESMYQEYGTAFDAGVWEQQDKGPWLARAIVYKSQVELHRDNNDLGLSLSFACGHFTGGAMLFPELGLKLAYNPGDVILSYAGRLSHKVTTWKPTAYYPAGITPGRIGTVFFFPKHSLQKLCGKPPGWGLDTGYGRYDCSSQYKPGQSGVVVEEHWEDSDSDLIER